MAACLLSISQSLPGWHVGHISTVESPVDVSRSTNKFQCRHTRYFYLRNWNRTPVIALP